MIRSVRFDQALQTATGNAHSGRQVHAVEWSGVDRQAVVKAHELLSAVEQHDAPPKEIVLDFDGTDVPVHGDQPLFLTPTTITIVTSRCTCSAVAICW